jgi:NAD(P)-dependent dehydrogenase (short-subunit alcohol dehydrogenase family)
MQLSGRVALVTGASRGIGRATALALGGRGAAVVLAARSLDPGGRLPGSLQETARALRAAGAEALPVRCDLADPDGIAQLAETALRWRGHVDVLVNNAAFLGTATFHQLDELSLVNWQRQLNVNVTAPLALCKALAPAMRSHGGGVIVNITSSAADMAEGDVPGIAYGATKAALNRLTLALARDLRPAGIAVFAVDPGYVRTEVAERAAAHPGWDIDIETAHPPEVAASAIAELVERNGDDVSGRFWRAAGGQAPALTHDGRGKNGQVSG